MEALVIKLKETVTNNKLPFLNHLRFMVTSVVSPNVNNYSLGIKTVNRNDTIEIIGDGHFTDSTMTQDLGKTASSYSNQKFSNGDYIIKLPLKGLIEFSCGNVDFSQCTDWQVEGLELERLIAMNKDTLLTLAFKNIADIYNTLSDTIKVTKFILVEKGSSTVDVQNIIEKIVETSGRTDDFAFGGKLVRDFYGTTNGVRNIHIITPYTQFEVYNEANTTLLYTATKVNNVWNYTNI